MKLKVSKKYLDEFIKEIKTLFRNPKFVGMLTVAVITVSLPVTILALNSNTDNRQHASGSNYCSPNTCTGANPNVYFCSNAICGHTDSPPNNTWRNTFNSTNGSCPSGTFCDLSLCSAGSSGKPPCTPIKDCSCLAGNFGKKGGAFDCNGIAVQRGCGSTLYCDDRSSTPRQGGLWPCSPNDPNAPPTTPPSNNPCQCLSGSPYCNSNGEEACTGGGHLRCGASSTTACHNTCSSNTCTYKIGSGSSNCSTTGSKCGGGYCGDGVCNNGETASSCPSDCGSSSGGGTDDKKYWECDTDPNFGACGGLVTQHGGPVWHYVTHNTSTGWACHDDTSTPCLGTISGHVFLDTNGNGTQDANEPNITGDLKTTISLNSGDTTVTTDANGNFTFAKGTPHQESLTGGDYTVAITTPPDGYVATTQSQTATISFTDRNPKDIALGIQKAAPPAPTDTPVPTDSPIPPDPSKTTGNITVRFEGIGLNENPTPLHPNRQIILYFYPVSDTSFQKTPYVSPLGSVTYNRATGYFSNASFPLKGLSEGSYLVLVKSPDGSLVTQIGTGDGTGPIAIVTTGGNNFIVDTQNQQDQNADITVPLLKMGDIITTGTSFNLVDTLDYSAFTDCYGQTPPRLSDACFQHQGIVDTKTQLFLPDLNDDGKVDGIDYTILEGNYGHYGIGGSEMNRGKDPTKN